MPAHSFISSSKLRRAYKISVLLLFVLLLLPVARALGRVYEEAAGKNKINAWSKARYEEFYAAAPRSIDMAFLGSSHSYCAFDPENIDAALGINSYQLGMPQQLPDATYYTLLELLNTQRPSTVVMELYWGVLEGDFDVKQADLLFLAMQNDRLKEDYFKNVFPLNEKVKYAIKPIRFQQDFFAYENKELLDWLEKKHNLKQMIRQFEGEEYYRSKGYIYCDYVMSDDEYARVAAAPGIDGRTWGISPTQRGYIEKIARLCEDSGIELIFVTAPVSNVSFRNIRHYDSIHRRIEELARELNAPYLDFNLENEAGRLFADEHFRDAGHLNDGGVKIADAYFVEWYNTISNLKDGNSIKN